MPDFRIRFMKDDLKVYAKLKNSPEDFVVEEIGEKWNCKVSQEFVSNLGTDISKLDMDIQKDFLWCELEKKDLDHLTAVKEVCRLLEISKDDLGYAGMKDKIAWTSQRISIFKPDLELLKNFSHERIILKNFKWNKRKIKIGYLDGNHFRIVLRDVDKKDAIKVSNKIRSQNWFPNYFGSQRFGSMRNNNVKIGKLLLKKKFKEAVFCILTDLGNEKEEISNARLRLRKEMDFEKVLEYFPKFLRLEYKLIDYLVRRKDDYLGAVRNVDKKSMLMFVNSVQSKIFNEILETALGEGLDFTKEGQKNCLLVGYKSRFYNGRLGEIEKEVLKSHDLSLEDFNLEEVGYLRIKGSFRKALVEVKDLEVEISDDEVFEGSKKIVLSFDLPSGTYATTFLENFFN